LIGLVLKYSKGGDKMKKMLLILSMAIMATSCTYYQSVTTQDDKLYVITNEGFGTMIWDNGIQECEKIDEKISCVEIKKD
jgi:hypothetical protein